MERLLLSKRRKDFPYYLCTGIALGLVQERRIWVKPRSRQWWTIVKESFDDDQWIENFRMTKETFSILCRELRPSLVSEATPVREPLDLDHKVAIAVYWLASCTEYRTVANLFGVGTSTVCKCVHSVCTAMSDTLMERYVKFPTNADLQDVIQGFDRVWGFPNCGGAIDATHIPIIAPVAAHGDYINRKGWYSIILQAVCDYKYIITDINVGWPGRVHDARVFGNSELFLKGERNDLFPNWPKKLISPAKEPSIPIVLLGDAAYPLKAWLLKPYTHQANLTAAQHLFNYKLSRARMTIENTFGRLKGRWRCLQKRLDVTVEFACTVVTACVILHNLCEMRRERYVERDQEEEHEDADADLEEAQPRAITLRDDLATYFATV